MVVMFRNFIEIRKGDKRAMTFDAFGELWKSLRIGIVISLNDYIGT